MSTNRWGQRFGNYEEPNRQRELTPQMKVARLKTELLKLIKEEVYDEECLIALSVLANKAAEERRQKRQEQQDDFHKNVYPQQNIQNVLLSYPTQYKDYKQLAEDYTIANGYFSIYSVAALYAEKYPLETISNKFLLPGEKSPKFYMAFIHEAELESIELTPNKRAWLGLHKYSTARKKKAWVKTKKMAGYTEEEASKILQKEQEKETELQEKNQKEQEKNIEIIREENKKREQEHQKKYFQKCNDQITELGYLWPTKLDYNFPKYIETFIKDENLREPTPDERVKLYGSKLRRKVYVRQYFE